MTRPRWALLSTALLLVAASFLTVGILGTIEQSPGPPVPPHAAQPVSMPPGAPVLPYSAQAVSAHSAHSRLKLARSTPVQLRIPAISVAVSVSKLGYNPDGTVEVPTDPNQPGWFKRGPTPGQHGSAVILGHVDSQDGPAVFYRLGALRKGDRLSVRLADGAVARFAVVSVATYRKSRFPARRVYGPRRYSALQLVTCGGKFDKKTGHYLSNVVVYTRLVATVRT